MKIENTKWNQRFIAQALGIADWSKDDSTKVGAVVYDKDRTPISNGYNGFPRGVDDTIPERHERPLKYKYVQHAEQNTINHCARKGNATEGCHIYTTHFPCSNCAGSIINSGLVKVIIDIKTFSTSYQVRWKEDIEVSQTMFDEAGVEVVFVDMDIDLLKKGE